MRCLGDLCCPGASLHRGKQSQVFGFAFIGGVQAKAQSEPD
jgi:hypothetical protein